MSMQPTWDVSQLHIEDDWAAGQDARPAADNSNEFATSSAPKCARNVFVATPLCSLTGLPHDHVSRVLQSRCSLDIYCRRPSSLTPSAPINFSTPAGT